ncbi:protein EMBRYONIC FLOWER 1-like protein [Cinnamomum micranthum f. kanehirae]|uniref:Protein EMBRYONIC FLOWER 1-like protein n=1 Tax=Cinnamomum micranthum f. kanehirae TaxID=337451 RepID=A0A3S3QDB9_9MAGN|nr:protein EMBRYONIC FLOWER 1-like protein [Cinnamomum micranthum f. kanehirae]
MEETIIDDCYKERSESIPVSKTSNLSIVERPSELGCADDQKVEEKCGHFSIRGYVAEVRKTDWKITWPFSVPDDCNESDEDAQWLPPLCVSEFRWWRCPNCLRRIGTGADTDAGVLVNCFCNEVKDDFTCFCENSILKTHDDAPMLLDSSLSLRTNKHASDLVLSKKPNFHDCNAFEAVTIKLKGNELLKYHEQCDTRGGSLDVGFNIEVPTYMSNGTSQFCRKDTIRLGRSHLVKMKKKHDKVMANYGTSLEVVKNAKSDVPLTVVVGPSSELNSIGLYQSDHNSSENSEDLAGIGTRGQHIAGQLGTSTLHRKRPRKTRFLTDIIRSEVPGVPNKILIFNKDAEINSIHTAVNNSKAESDLSKDLDLLSGLKTSLVVHEDGKKHITSKKLSRTVRAADKGPSLMSWLKGTVGKVKINKKNGRGKPVAPVAFDSKSALDVSTGTILHPSQIDVGTQRSSRKVMASKKQKKMTRVEDERLFLNHRRKSTSRKLKTNAGNAKRYSTNVVQSKSAEDALPGSCGHQDSNHRKAVQHKTKNEKHRTEDGTSSLMYWLKDSLDTSTCGPVTDLEGHQNSHEYEQRTSKACEQDSSDDIPMEIVELMAKNQRERHLLNVEDTAGNSYNMQETNSSMKVPDMMDFTEVRRKEVPGFLHKKTSSVQKSQSSNAGSGRSTAGKKVGKPCKKWNCNPSCNCGKYNNIHLRMRQLEQSCAYKGFVPFSECQEKPSSGVPVTVSDLNSDRWSLTCKQFLEAYHKSRTAPRESSCGQTHDDELQILSNSMQFDNNTPHRFDDLSHRCILCHCTNPLPKRNHIDNNGNHDLEPNSPDPAHHLQKQKGEDVSDTDNRNIPGYAFCFMKQGYEYNSMMGPLDLCTNEAISAMNLLRLMDQGACSSTPVDISVVRKQAIPLKKPEFSHNNHHEEFFGVENGEFRSGNSSMFPKSFEFFDQKHRQGSSCELLSPVCKIGELGSSLHDSTHDSSRSRTDLGFKSGLSNKTSSKFHRKGKTKGSPSSTQTRHRSSRRFLAKDENLGNAKKRVLSTSDFVGQSKINEMARSMKNCCMTEICATNRNPADFTIPGAENAYMIGREDLKFMDVFPSSDRLFVTTNIDGHKRRRMMKLTAIHGH